LLIFNILEFSAGENTNYSKSLSNQSTTWKVGLGLSYPIGGIKADSNLKKTNMELEEFFS
jgi:outer membrane protein TolC